MKFIKNIFFLVFLGALLVTSLQFSLFDAKNISSIQLVEEENEESNLDAEMLTLEFYEEQISSPINGFQNYEAHHFQEFHAQKKYKTVYISVPYSPPDLS